MRRSDRLFYKRDVSVFWDTWMFGACIPSEVRKGGMPGDAGDDQGL